jgi:hypothetical protein
MRLELMKRIKSLKEQLEDQEKLIQAKGSLYTRDHNKVKLLKHTIWINEVLLEDIERKLFSIRSR